MVVGKGHRQGIQTELQQRHGKAGSEQDNQRHRRHDRQGQRGNRQAHGYAADQYRAIVAIRQPAQRPLHQQAGKDAAAHEQTDVLGAQPLLGCI
ncbi:hypothetical protein D3C80_1546010 [compost metagenome]